MRITRIVLFGLVAATAAPATLAAQSFEGVVSGNRFDGAKAHPFTIEVKGRRWRGQDDRGDGLISDGNGTVLMVDTEHRMYRRMPNIFAANAAVMSRAKLTPTGKHETVAGQSCEYYALNPGPRPSEIQGVCITQALGSVGIEGAFNFCAGGSAVRSEFAKGCMVLKVLDRRSAPLYEVTRIERRPVSDAELAPPAGFTEVKASGMAGAGND
jgi:hypothetical protein